MLATAVVAVGLAVYITKAQFKVVGLLTVSDVAPMIADDKVLTDSDYNKVLASVFEELQSDAVIRDAVQNAVQDAISVDEIRSRLDVRNVGDSELLMVSLRGRKFRDDKAAFMAILEEMLQRCVEAFSNDATDTSCVTEVKIRSSPTIR